VRTDPSRCPGIGHTFPVINLLMRKIYLDGAEYTVPATAVRTSAISTGCLSSCFYASVSVSRPVSKKQKLSAPSISILQFTIMIPCALCYIMVPGALCTAIITITLFISSTGVSTGCLSPNYLSATDSVRTAVVGTAQPVCGPVQSDLPIGADWTEPYR